MESQPRRSKKTLGDESGVLVISVLKVPVDTKVIEHFGSRNQNLNGPSALVSIVGGAMLTPYGMRLIRPVREGRCPKVVPKLSQSYA